MTNLYRHADGGFYCLLSSDAAGKDETTGDWLSGVIYTGVDQQMRFTTMGRWLERFANVAEYTGDDEAVWAMIRRCNPEEYAPEDVWAAWHDSETQTTAESIQLGVATALAAGIWNDDALPKRQIDGLTTGPTACSLTIGPRHLQHVLQNYEVTREAVEGGYKITIRK